jgi:hypothetical protein
VLFALVFVSFAAPVEGDRCWLSTGLAVAADAQGQFERVACCGIGEILKGLKERRGWDEVSAEWPRKLGDVLFFVVDWPGVGLSEPSSEMERIELFKEALLNKAMSGPDSKVYFLRKNNSAQPGKTTEIQMRLSFLILVTFRIS